jgi:hypothetical protein
LQAKTAVLVASLLAGVVGYFALRDGGQLSQSSNAGESSHG